MDVQELQSRGARRIDDSRLFRRLNNGLTTNAIKEDNMGELILMGLGAALMYFLDPTHGRDRRLWVREQWGHRTKKSTEATWNALGKRLQGSKAAGEVEDPAKKAKS
jgi:hypothetical protein